MAVAINYCADAVDDDGEDDSNANRWVPEDCIYNIITRVTFSTLQACLQVQRQWRRLAHDPTFEAEHSRRTRAAYGFMLQTLRRGNYKCSFLPIHGRLPRPLSLSFLPSNHQTAFRIEAAATSNGILLCATEHFSSSGRIAPDYFISRPATLHHRRIPNPSIPFPSRGAAIVCGGGGGQLKIVRISEVRKARLVFEVFESGTDTWRRTCDFPYVMLRSRQGLVVRRSAYWMVQEYDEGKRDGAPACSLLVFDAEKERARLIRGPAAFSGPWPEEWRMVACVERLCLFHVLNEDIKVWEMVGGQRWQWRGVFSKQRVVGHAFAFEAQIREEDLVLLENIYRELWYQFFGRELVDPMNPPQSIFRMHLDFDADAFPPEDFFFQSSHI